jgi:hypothetical protein
MAAAKLLLGGGLCWLALKMRAATLFPQTHTATLSRLTQSSIRANTSWTTLSRGRKKMPIGGETGQFFSTETS